MKNAVRTGIAAGVAAGAGLVPVTMNGAIAAPVPYTATARVELTTNNPDAGGVLRIQISSFPPLAQLVVDLRGSASVFRASSVNSDQDRRKVRLATFDTDRDGAFTGSVTMPEGWQCQAVLKTLDPATGTKVLNPIVIGDAERC
ncbi:MAG: hypothetical protein ACT4P1_00570 [Sporichthyaceae bacterium]